MNRFNFHGRGWFLLASSLAIVPSAFAATTQLQTQVDNAANLRRCINDAVAGANMSYANAAKKDKCFIPIKAACLLFGHGSKTEPAWRTDGDNFTKAARNCYSTRVDTVNNAVNLTGTGIAMNGDVDINSSGNSTNGDIIFSGEAGGGFTIDKNGKFSGDDGSRNFGLPDGTIMSGVLSGQDAKDIIAGSPYASKLSAQDKDTLLSDPDKWKDQLAKLGIGNATGDGADLNAAPAANTKGQSVDDLLADLGLGGEEGAAEEAKKEMTAEELAALETAKADAEGDAAARALANYRSRSDRTIFQMVTTQYKKRGTELLTVDFLVRQRALQKQEADKPRMPASQQQL